MAKLTLSIDAEVIRRAKQYARGQGRSLSDVVENYLKLLTTDITKMERSDVNEPKTGYSPIEKWRGSLKLLDDRGYKEILKEELWRRYLK